MSSIHRFLLPAWMASSRTWCFILLVLSTFLSSTGQNHPGNTSASSLNNLIIDYALREFIQLRTGVLYEVPLPTNFSGMEASVMRLRGGSLWIRGANVSAFRVPPRTLSVPFERRLALVYQDLGNWSASYYRVPGHSAVTPVLGLLAYDAPSNTNSTPRSVAQLDLRVTGDPISVSFAHVSLPPGTIAAARCAKFELNGSLHLGMVEKSNVCSTTSPGHFAIVVPSPSPAPTQPATSQRNRAWRVWAVASGVGAVGLVLVGLAGAGIFLHIKNKRMEKMEGQAEVGEVLKTVWVGESRMPSATMVRTRPVIENGSAP